MHSEQPTALEQAHKGLVDEALRTLGPTQLAHGNPLRDGEAHAAEGSWTRKGGTRILGRFTLHVRPQVHLKLYDLTAAEADRVLAAWLLTVASPMYPPLSSGPESVADQPRDAWHTMYPTGEIFDFNPDKHFLIWSGWRTDEAGHVCVLELPQLTVPHAQSLQALADNPTAPLPSISPREEQSYFNDEPPF